MCYCIFRHPQNEKERAAVVKGLEYARSIGDSQGTLIALAQLGRCPAQKGAVK